MELMKKQHVIRKLCVYFTGDERRLYGVAIIFVRGSRDVWVAVPRDITVDYTIVTHCALRIPN